jgi:hypothetical protein
MNNSTEESSSKDPVEEFKNILDDVEENGKEISETGRQITAKGQYMVDIAQAAKQVIPYLPPHAVENLISDWKPFAQQTGLLIAGLQSLNNDVVPSSDSTAGTATISITGSFPYPNQSIPAVPLTSNPEAKSAIENLHYVAGRFTDVAQTRELLKTFRLDKARKGKQSPLQLFNTAHEAFERPVSNVDPVITSLIPMRECIRLVIDDLLKRSPGQEKTGNDYFKLISIGKRSKRDTIPLDTFESLAEIWHKDISDKELSDAKEAYIGREEWSRRLQRATQFLFSLLSGLDPTKLKSR